LERASAGLILLFMVFVFRLPLDLGCFLWLVKAGFLFLFDLLVPTWSGPSVILLEDLGASIRYSPSLLIAAGLVLHFIGVSSDCWRT
jgi:hypothetical protein